MAVFPQAPLGVMVELYLGSWTDVSTYVYQRDLISITTGRPPQASQASPAQATLTLNQRDGRFSVNNPLGPYYGTLVRNTPLRLSIPNSLLPSPSNATYLRLEDDTVSYASCPAASRIELTASFEVRIDVSIHGYGPLVLAGIWQASASVPQQRSWALVLTPTGQLGMYLSPDGTGLAQEARSAYSDPNAPLPLGRLVIRATVNTANGVVAFSYAPAGQINATAFTPLGTTVVYSLTGAFNLFASTTQPLTVGYAGGLEYDAGVSGAPFENAWLGTLGSIHDFELRSSIGGTIVAQPAFNTQTAGATTWTDSPGNPWSLNGSAALSNRSFRFHGELAQMPKAADPSQTDIYTQAMASGVLRRLQQQQSPLNSAMYRAVTNQASAAALAAPALAYWPCEDGIGATQIGSAISGVAAMTISGTPQLSSSTVFACSDALPVLASSRWSGNVTAPGVSWTQNLLGLLLMVPSAGETNGALIGSVFTTGTFARIDLVYTSASSGSVGFNCYNAGGTLVGSNSVQYELAGAVTVGVNGYPALIELNVTTSGANVVCTITARVPLSGEVTSANASATGTVGAVTRVMVNSNGTLANSVVGHVFVANAADNSVLLTGPGYGPLGAWLGEPAGSRVQRLCIEEGIGQRIYGHPGLTAPMGTQTLQTLAQLLQECETTDRGMMNEPVSSIGIGYRTLTSLYSQAATASASFTSAAVAAGFSSIVDDLLTINDVTATNIDGSSARQYLPSGPMSVLAPPAGIGRVDTQVQVNAASDTQLQGVAQWILHTTTDPHDRFPAIPFDMARSQTPAAIPLLKVGDVLAVTSPPSWIQYDEIDQVCAGFTETLGPFGVWQIGVNAIPAYPYAIFSVAPAVSGAASFAGGGPFATHVDTDGTTLTSNVNSTAGALSFTTAAVGMPVWTTNPVDFPFDVGIGGERITVVGPGACLGTDPFQAGGITDYSGQSAAVSVSGTHGAPPVANGYSTNAILVAPAGSPATSASVVGVGSGAGTVTTSTGYTVWAWVYNATGRIYQLFANWLLGSGFVSSSFVAGTTIPAGVWTLVTGTLSSPASGVNAVQLGITDSVSPGVGNTFYVWGLNGCATAGIDAASPQGFTAVRSVNGVVKSQSAGTGLSLWYPPVIGL
jgi:hypothetical protein